MPRHQLYPEQPDSDQLLRDVRNDLRFLSYRAGRPHPFVLKYALFALLLIFAPIFVAEVRVTFIGPIQAPRHPAGSVSHVSKEVQP
jgi:hypothetical protein